MEPRIDEQTKWKGSPDALASFLSASVLFPAIVAAAALHPAVTAVLERSIGAFVDPASPAGAALLYFVPAIFGAKALWVFLHDVTTGYEITDERLVVRHGLVVRTEDEIELYRIVDVVQMVNLLQRFIGVGTVRASSTDRTGVVFMKSIANSGTVRNGLRKLAEECKDRRGRVRILE